MKRTATVFGGSGFLGRHVVQRLAARGVRVRVAVRDLESANYLKPLGDVGQVVPTWADVKDPDSVARAVQGADWVVNLVGILSEWGGQSFDLVHAQGAEAVAHAAAEARASRLVHVSAIGADPNAAAKYAATKGRAEESVRQAFKDAVILRPSVVFGPEDGFFNKFAGMARLSPVLPVIGCPLIPKVACAKEEGGLLDIDFYGPGGPKFQPVYVGDVAEAVMRGLEDPATSGKTFELGGPRTYSFKEVMELLLRHIERKRLLVPVTYGQAKFLGAILGLLPNPVLTGDQVEMLKTDNVVSEGAPGLDALGITPTAAEAVLPTYLHRYRSPERQRLRPA